MRRQTFEYYLGTPNVRTATREPGDAFLERETEFGRDAMGNIEEVIERVPGAEPRSTVVTYDTERMLPTTITNALEQTTQVRHDHRHGRVIVRADPNGIDETWTYDDFGILRSHRGADGVTHIDYETASNYEGDLGIPVQASYRVHTRKLGGQHTLAEYNALGQLVHRESGGLLGTLVREEFGYDLRNRIRYRSRPHLPGDSSQGVIEYTHDDLDRLTRVIYPDQTDVEIDYALRSSIGAEYYDWLVPGATTIRRVRDANGHSSIEASDRSGQTLAVFNPARQVTQYSWGAFGTMRSIVAPTGAVWFEHDAYNRTVTVTDAALGGSRTAEYNGFDEVTVANDAAERRTEIAYDLLGRPESATSDIDGITRWTYDGTGPNETGRLVSETSPSGQITEYGYEAPQAARNRGLLTSITQRLVEPVDSSTSPPRVLVTSYAYDDFSRLSTVRYPGNDSAPFEVAYGFDGAGNVVRVQNAARASTYWELIDTHQGYRAKTEHFLNGVETGRNYGNLNGNLTQISTGASATGLVQQLTYGHDDIGQITSRSDLQADISEHFTYDNLDRLLAVTDASSTVVEEYRYTLPDSLTDTGRLVYKSGVGDYGYRSTGRDWIESAGAHTYGHDSVGNIQLRTGPSVPGGTQLITYTSFDLPSRIVSGTSQVQTTHFGYDASGNRVVKHSDAGTVYYAGKHYTATTRAAAPGEVSHQYVIYAGGRAIGAAIQTETQDGFTSPSFSYFHDDALGSVHTVTSSSGIVESARHFTPFGAPSSPAPSSAHPRYGFTGHEQDDDLGLVNMNGRLYDPVLGQFLSPDPVIQRPEAHGLNRYAYVFNNPLNYTDPSGFSSEVLNDAEALVTNPGVIAGAAVYGAGLYATLAVTPSVGAGTMSTFGAASTAASAGTAATAETAAFASGASGLVGQGTSVAVGAVSLGIQNAWDVKVTTSTRAINRAGGSGGSGVPKGSNTKGHAFELTTEEAPSLFDRERGALACWGPATQMCISIAQAAMNSPAGRAAQRVVDRYGPTAMTWFRAKGAQLAQSVGRFIKGAEAWRAPSVFTNRHGQLTNGTYTLDSKGMEPHISGSSQGGKSQFLYGINERQLVLDGAAYADKLGAWVGNKAKITFDVNIGVHGKSGELTKFSTFIEAIRASSTGLREHHD